MSDKNKNCKCTEENHCGCLDGKECTCGNECHCHEEGHECHCGDECHCHEEGHECHCGAECHCHEEGHECHCGEGCHCHEDECGCGCEHEHLTKDEIISRYEIAFSQFEEALIKVDKELMLAKRNSAENERLAATYKKDLERYKERAKEQEEALKINAIENVADKLIPILDNFEQALKVTGDPKVTKGFEMIEGMLKNAVTSLGIEEIDTFDEEFNPNFHNAVSRIRTKDKKKDNKIASVYQKGYKMAGENGKVIRHSMVEIYLLD